MHDIVPKLKKQTETPVLKHLKNTHRIQKMADFLRMMRRWGFYDEIGFEKEIDRLQCCQFLVDHQTHLK